MAAADNAQIAEIRERLRTEALSWVGTPFHHDQSLKGVGVDCARLIIEVYAAAGLLESYRPEYYPPDWFLHQDRERYLEELDRHGFRRLHKGEVVNVGDIFGYRLGRCVAQGGIFIGDSIVVMAIYGKRVEAIDPWQKPLAERFAGAWRHPWLA